MCTDPPPTAGVTLGEAQWPDTDLIPTLRPRSLSPALVRRPMPALRALVTRCDPLRDDVPGG